MKLMNAVYVYTYAYPAMMEVKMEAPVNVWRVSFLLVVTISMDCLSICV